jgi:3-oxo-5-alpha-steroid 4-dehydrogenase 3
MDPVQVLRNFYLLASTLLVSFNVVPSLQQRFLKYGARATKVKDEHGKPIQEPESNSRLSKLMDLVASFGVPHSWFTHFYIASVASSVFWAIQVARKGLVFRFLAELHLDNSVNEPSMAIDQVVLVWTLMAIQGCRRLYECITLTKPTTSKMGAVAYLLGLVFYLAMGVVVWVEGIRKIDACLPHHISLLIVKASILANDISFQSLATMIQPSVKTAIGVPLFLLGSIAQNTCHTYLASLKKYSLPEEGLFRGIISPHYTSECVIYLGLAIAGAPPGQPLNKTIATVVFFEAINLGITAESTRAWYSEKFGAKSIEGRWRIFPYAY